MMESKSVLTGEIPSLKLGELLTGVIIFKDDRKKPIRECLESFQPYLDKFLLYDGSSDGTLEIIKKYAKKPYKVVKESIGEPDFARFRNECLDLVDTDWAFFFWTDEVLESRYVSPQEFRDRLLQTKENSFAIARWNEPKGIDYPDYQPNVVRVKGGCRYARKLHEMLVPPPRQAFAGLEIRHKLRPISELEKRDKRWMEIDPETEGRHRDRSDIKERIRQEYEASKRMFRKH